MDHVTIEESNVVERYLLGQLAAADAARFEEHYLDCPDCLEQLELSKRLCQGLKEVAAEEETRLAGAAVLAWLLRRGRGLQATLAAALLAVVILPWALLVPEVSRLSGEHQRLAGELAQALSPQARTPTYSLSPERSGPGEEPSTRITLGTTPEWVVLALQLPPPQSPSPTVAFDAADSYRVRLMEAEGAFPTRPGEPIWHSGQIEPDAAGPFPRRGTGEILTFSVHSTWLEAADYVVELDALTPTGESQPMARFAFRVRRDE